MDLTEFARVVKRIPLDECKGARSYFRRIGVLDECGQPLKDGWRKHE